MSIKNALRLAARKMFGRSIEVIDLEIKFHKDANLYGTHGHLKASHVDMNLNEGAVRFVFMGMSTPPALTPRIIDYIFEEARAEGYIPHALTKYGMVIPTDAVVKGSDLVTEARRRAERDAAAIKDGVDRRVDNVAAMARS